MQWTPDVLESWNAPSVVVRSTELEGPLAHLAQTPDFTETEGPER